MIQNRDDDFATPTRDEEFPTQRQGSRITAVADRDADFLATGAGWPGVTRPAAAPPPSPSPSALIRTADGTLVQSINLPGDSEARWRVRVNFDGEVAGAPVCRGDVLLIGRAIFEQIIHLPFALLGGGV